MSALILTIVSAYQRPPCAKEARGAFTDRGWWDRKMSPLRKNKQDEKTILLVCF